MSLIVSIDFKALESAAIACSSLVYKLRFRLLAHAKTELIAGDTKAMFAWLETFFQQIDRRCREFDALWSDDVRLALLVDIPEAGGRFERSIGDTQFTTACEMARHLADAARSLNLEWDAWQVPEWGLKLGHRSRAVAAMIEDVRRWPEVHFGNLQGAISSEIAKAAARFGTREMPAPIDDPIDGPVPPAEFRLCGELITVTATEMALLTAVVEHGTKTDTGYKIEVQKLKQQAYRNLKASPPERLNKHQNAIKSKARRWDLRELSGWWIVERYPDRIPVGPDLVPNGN